MLFHGLWFDPEIIDLPLSRRRGGIAQIPSSAGQKWCFPFLPVRSIPLLDAEHPMMVLPYPVRQGYIHRKQRCRARGARAGIE